MKRYFFVLLVIALMLSLTSCGEGNFETTYSCRFIENGVIREIEMKTVPGIKMLGICGGGQITQHRINYIGPEPYVD